jgi:hypothetical protein
MRLRPAGIAAVVAFVALPAAASAATLDVCPSGCSYTTPQAAVDAVASGDTVSIAPGTYPGIALDAGFSTDGLTIRGAGAAATTLTGGLSIANAAPLIDALTIRDMTVSGASAGDPSSVVSAFASDGGVRDLTLRSVVLDGGGDELTLLNGRNLTGTLTLVDAELRDSTAACIAATRCVAAAGSYPDAVVLDGVRVHDVAGAVLLRGAGAATPIPAVRVSSTTFTDVGPLERADGALGALVVRNAADLTIEDSRFFGVAGGPAMSLRGIGSALVQRNQVAGAALGILVEDAAGDAPGPEHWDGTIVRNDVAATGDALSFPTDFDPAGLTLRGNSLRGALSYAGTGTLDATRNWWGCNQGPGATGCSTATGSVSTAPRLLLSLIATPSTVPSWGSTTLQAFMRDSASQALVPFAHRPILFSAPFPSAARWIIGGSPVIDGFEPATAALNGIDASSLWAVTLDYATVSAGIDVERVGPVLESQPWDGPPRTVTGLTPEQLAQQEAFVSRRRTQTAMEQATIDAAQLVRDATQRVLLGDPCGAHTPPEAGVTEMREVILLYLTCTSSRDAERPLSDLDQALAALDEKMKVQRIQQAEDAARLAGLQAQRDALGSAMTIDEALAQLAEFLGTTVEGLQALIAQNGEQLAFLDGAHAAATEQAAKISKALRGKKGRPRAAGASLTRAEAWSELAVLRAELRALTGTVAAPPRHRSVRIRSHRATPLLAVACPSGSCHVAVRRVLTVAGHRIRVATRRLAFSGSPRTVSLRLTQGQRTALRRQGRAKLAVTVVVGGAKATTTYTLRPS